MPLDVMKNDRTYSGTVSYTGTINVPAGTIDNADVNAGAAIAATKLEHQFPISKGLVAPGVAVTAMTKLLHIVAGATGEIVSIEAAVTTIATGADRSLSVDLQKSTAGGAFATVLSATADIDDEDTVRTAYAGTVSSASLVDGDILELIVTVAGSAANQAEGLIVTVQLREDPA